MTTTDLFAGLAASRHSVRAFRPDPVGDEVLHGLLRTARQAPSGANLQPGQLIQVRGAVRSALTADLVCRWRAGEQEIEDYAYFPRPLPMRLRRRQVAAAQALYGALGVQRDDRSGRDAQFERNFDFFGAPVALIVTIERDFGPGGYMDLGMALYGLMLAAESRGLATCAVGAMASYPGVIRQHLQIEESQSVVCGMALGYADPDAAVNRTRTQRVDLEEFFRVVG